MCLEEHRHTVCNSFWADRSLLLSTQYMCLFESLSLSLSLETFFFQLSIQRLSWIGLSHLMGVEQIEGWVLFICSSCSVWFSLSFSLFLSLSLLCLLIWFFEIIVLWNTCYLHLSLATHFNSQWFNEDQEFTFASFMFII